MWCVWSSRRRWGRVERSGGHATLSRMNPLAKVTDGADLSQLSREAAFSFLSALPTLALIFGIKVVGGGAGVALAVLAAVIVARWMVARRPGRERQMRSGVWLMTVKGHWSRWFDAMAPLVGAAIALALAAVAWGLHEPGWELVYLLLTAAGFGVQAILAAKAQATPRDEVELRIDAEGLYARQFGGTLRWNEILDILPRRRGDKMLVRMAIGPSALPLIPEGRRVHGGIVELNLSNVYVTREAALAAMATYRSLHSSPPDDIFVQPIEGVYVDEPVNTDAALGPILVGAAFGVVAAS